MNKGRVLIGGLLAGLVLNVAEYVFNEVIMKARWEAAMAEMDMPEMTGGDIGILVGMGFLTGILLVWLYAAVRPRLGAGPMTAVKVGLAAWFLLSFWPFVWNMLMPMYPADLMRIGLIWSLFELPIVTVIGAWIYKEHTTVM